MGARQPGAGGVRCPRRALLTALKRSKESEKHRKSRSWKALALPIRLGTLRALGCSVFPVRGRDT